MRKVLEYLFPFTVFMTLTPAYAEPPFQPVANCQFGRCVMSEADYNTFREYVIALKERVMQANDIASQAQGENESLRSQLVRNAYCQIHRD